MLPIPRALLALFMLCPALWFSSPTFGRESPAAATVENAPKKQAQAGKLRGAAKTRAPERVTLPEAGVYPVSTILRLAEKLAGRTLRIDRKALQKARVKINRDIGETEVSLDEIAVILGASRVYLFLVDDPEEGRLLVASGNPHWRYEPRRHTRIVEVGIAKFSRIAGIIRKAVQQRNSRLVKGAEPMVAVPDPRTGKIFLSSPRRADIDAVLEAIQAARNNRPDGNRPRLYTYQGKFRRVGDLEKALLEKLQEGEINRLRLVIALRGNRILFRCPPALGEKVLGILSRLDARKPARRMPR